MDNDKAFVARLHPSTHLRYICRNRPSRQPGFSVRLKHTPIHRRAIRTIPCSRVRELSTGRASGLKFSPRMQNVLVARAPAGSRLVRASCQTNGKQRASAVSAPGRSRPIHVVPLRSGHVGRLDRPERCSLLAVRNGRIDGLSDDAGISDFDPSELFTATGARCDLISTSRYVRLQ